MVTKLLSESDARAVEAAVARVESHSSAEVVVAIVTRSHDYWQARVLLAAAWALAAGLAFLLLLPWAEPVLALAVQLGVGGLALLVSGWSPLLRLMISTNAAAAAAQARALQLFAERGLHRTRGRTALLVLVSELEHRVVLLGDHAIDATLGQAGWQQHVEQLIARIRGGQACAGLLELLEQLGPKLAEVAPPRLDDVNELPDAPLHL